MYRLNRTHFTLTLSKDRDCHWYIDVQGLPVTHYKALFIGDVDELCDAYAQGDSSFRINLFTSPVALLLPGCVEFMRNDSNDSIGTYSVNNLPAFSGEVHIYATVLIAIRSFPLYVYAERA